MKDAMISVRMPESMIKELKELAEENHYVDLSEQLRDVIRIKCAKLLSEESAVSGQRTEYSKQQTGAERRTQPTSAERRTQLTGAERRTQITDKERLVMELSKIVEELKKGI